MTTVDLNTMFVLASVALVLAWAAWGGLDREKDEEA